MQNFAYKKNIKGIEVNKRGYFNFQNTISKYWDSSIFYKEK